MLVRQVVGSRDCSTVLLPNDCYGAYRTSAVFSEGCAAEMDAKLSFGLLSGYGLRTVSL